MLPLFPIFKKLELIDRKDFETITKKFPPYSDYNFVSFWSYNIENDFSISTLHNNLVIQFRDYITNEPFYSFLGNNNIEDTIKTLLIQAKKTKIILYLKLIPEINIINNKELFTLYTIKEDKDNFDYVYSLEELSKLSGKKYDKKRNKIHVFRKMYPDAFIQLLDLKNISIQNLILNVFNIWEKNKRKERVDTVHELIAIKRLLKDAYAFNILCIGVYINKELKGFGVIEVLSNQYANFHFIKADPLYKGIFEFLYKSAAEELYKRGCLYLNREQDLGISGLRDAKISWRPILFLKKYTISRKK